MMIYDDDNGAGLQPQDDYKWPAEKAFAAMFAAGLACWVVIGAIVWLVLGEVGA